MDSDEDPVQLRAEITSLKQGFKDLIVERNLMEHKLFRAFNKLLNTKKRRIRRLDREIKRLKGSGNGNCSSDEDKNHCDTCRCGSVSKKKIRRRIPLQINDDGGSSRPSAQNRDEDDGSETEDPTNYNDETDVDDDPAARRIASSSNSSKTTSPSKMVVVKCHEPTGSSIEATFAEPIPNTDEETDEAVPISNIPPTVAEAKSKCVLPKNAVNLASEEEDMDQLIDEFLG